MCIRLYRDNGKEHGHYHNGLYGGYHIKELEFIYHVALIRVI